MEEEEGDDYSTPLLKELRGIIQHSGFHIMRLKQAVPGSPWLLPHLEFKGKLPVELKDICSLSGPLS